MLEYIIYRYSNAANGICNKTKTISFVADAELRRAAVMLDHLGVFEVLLNELLKRSVCGLIDQSTTKYGCVFGHFHLKSL